VRKVIRRSSDAIFNFCSIKNQLLIFWLIFDLKKYRE